MSDNDPGRTRESTAIVDDLDEDDAVPELPNFPDHEEFVKTQEMDSLQRSKALEATQNYTVPDDLLQMAMRSQEMAVVPESKPSEPAWREFVAVVDPRGRIVLPSRVQQDLRGKKLRVKYIVETPEH